MNLPSQWQKPIRHVRRQQSYIAVAVAIYAALWAAGNPVPLGRTLIYTVCLCNIITLMQDHLGFAYQRGSVRQSWLRYFGLLLVVAIAGVTIVNLIQFPVQRAPGQTLGQFLKSGWKFPFMAAVIFGVSSQVYRWTRERLEARNRELEQVVEVHVAQRERQDQELQQAREIQQSLLPKEMPQIAGFEIEGAWEPARVVGGDYFDVIRLSDTKLGICIADVVGKSVSAALLMANVQASVRAFASEEVDPAALCARVNSVLCASIGSGKFVTLFYGVLDAAQKVLRYASAGHPHPIVISVGGEIGELEDGGAVLGVFPDWQYKTSSLHLSAGDRLVLFTDGITEAENRQGEEFGESRLGQLAQTHAAESSSELKASLFSEVRSFCDSQFGDDATLIVISVLSDRSDPAHPESAELPESKVLASCP